MKIELTKQQFKEMLLASMLYSWIMGGLADRDGKDFEKFSKLQNFLLEIAEKENMKDFFERFHGHLVPHDKLDKKQMEIIEDYNEDEFWHRLNTYLGKRDFYCTTTEEEKQEIKKNEWLPERIHEIYKKYWDEFEKHGIERLKIVEK